MRIGLFGGSFDPVHNAHIKIAEEAYKQYALDKVIFIPARNPPHRYQKKLTDIKDRVKILKLALSRKKNFELSEFELRRRKTTYTCETINYFKKKFPDSEIFFIIGSDSLREMRYWKKGYDLLKFCRFIVAKRPGFKLLKKGVLYLKDISESISSTFIRQNICDAKVKHLLPQAVFQYIKKNLLYLDETILSYLKKHLDSAKYKHTLGTSKIAKLLALRFKANIKKAQIAALLHDLGRAVKLKNYTGYIKKNKLKIPMKDEIKKHNPFLFHSYISSHLAQKIFNIKDKEILKAVENHTLGVPRQKATVYDKIIYISDTIAPDRRFPGVSEIRKIAFSKFTNIDRIVLMCCALKLHYVIKKKRWLAPSGVEVFNSYL